MALHRNGTVAHATVALATVIQQITRQATAAFSPVSLQPTPIKACARWYSSCSTGCTPPAMNHC
jgi:hypothetical protein